MCNFSRYLEEQEHECRRQCLAHNLDTPVALEWGRAALEIQQMNFAHHERCESCQRTHAMEAV